jgi:hypothetical protein
MFRMEISVRYYESRIVEIGLFTFPGWSGHAMWYGFYCPHCDAVSADYLHGFVHYLECRACQWRWYVHARRFYAQTGMERPEGRTIRAHQRAWVS